MKKYKYEIVIDCIRREYIDNPDGDGSIPSEPVLAKKLNVSRFPVNQAVSQLVDEGVLVRVDGIGTFVKGREPEAIKLRRQKPHNLLGVISQTGALKSTLLKVLTQELSGEKYFLGNVFQDESDNYYEYIINKVRATPIKGLFLNPGIFFDGDGKISPSLELANKLMAEKIPTVIIDRPLKGYSGPRVLADNVGGTSTAIQWMLENGHDKVAYFGKDDYVVGYERFMGYRVGIEYAGQKYDNSLVALDRSGADFISGIGDFMEANIRRILSKHPDCRAFMAFNVTFAYCLYRKLCEMKLFREDMIIGGFERLSHYDPDFDKCYLVLENSFRELGRVAANMMIRQLAQKEPIKEVKRIQPEMYLPEERSPLCIEKLKLLA